MGAAIALMETSPGDENINDDVKLCLFFNSNIAADLARSRNHMDADLHMIKEAYSYEYKGYYFAWLGNI